jgi:predicted NACHT family NTPase
VFIVGKGGAGKSTLLTHFTRLALNSQLSENLKGFCPIYVPSYYYREDLIQAITIVLRERDGVNVTKEVVNTQLQSGRFIILVDGLSEVEQGDKAQVVKDVLRIAKSAEYKPCRFILATRPLESFPGDISIVDLQPLTKEILLSLIPHCGLTMADENRLTRQLRFFDDKPLEPLLFTMAVVESATEQMSATRAGLYERYFQRLLQIKPNDILTWRGWQDALENIAEWSLLETANRGAGLRHQDLVNRISREEEGRGLKENLVKRLNRLYRLPIKNELELLDKLYSSGLLNNERRWRFAHDTFEEFFAASRLVSLIDQNNQWPALQEWYGKEKDFFEIINFVVEMAESKILEKILSLDFPASWKEHLAQAIDIS